MDDTREDTRFYHPGGGPGSVGVPGCLGMTGPELADAVEAIARSMGGGSREVLIEAARRLRHQADCRDALADRVAEVVRLQREIGRARCGGA